MISAFVSIFKIPELRKKIIFTLLMLCIYRVGFYIPLPGVDKNQMKAITDQVTEDEDKTAAERAADYIQIFTGGNLRQSSLFGLGIMPYISASIILQLLTTVIPSLEKLSKEGTMGRKKIQEYTRWLTVGLCIVQGAFILGWMVKSGFVYSEILEQNRILFFMMGVCAMTAGTVFLMWLGEQIDEYGIGNGISLIIMAGIVSRMPNAVISLKRIDINPLTIVVLIIAFIGVIAGAIFITQAQRRIPVQQAKTTRGRRVYGGQKQYLPLRLNHGGVIPIIFAVTLMQFPTIIFKMMAERWPSCSWLGDAFLPTSFVYNFLYIALIYFFAFFWTTVQFQPKEVANNLRDYGSFIPGLRPGKRTAEYLENVMTRITYVGAGSLALIAVIPALVMALMGIPFGVATFLGGTGLLIVVSVSLDLVQKIETQLIMRNYSGFMDSGKIKGSRS
ncbi:MAG: preprotein translocase subunit SecY [Phycisphaerae bacterium]|nr:preprotein translocase subunit SecY [Phycisphaerae bacterium]